MTAIEKKHADRYLLLDKLHHCLEGSLHASTDIMNAGLSLGFEPGYVMELFDYLRVNGYIEVLGNTSRVLLTPYGLRVAERTKIAA